MHNNTSSMENASWAVVLVLVLNNHYNPIIQINPYYPSRPGKHPSSEPNRASARLDSRPRKTPTNRTEPRNSAVIFSPGGSTNQPNRTAQLHSVAWQGFGSLPNSLLRLWETPCTTYYSSLVITSRLFLLTQLGRASPYWWVVPTHFPDSSSQCVWPAGTGSQLGL